MQFQQKGAIPADKIILGVIVGFTALVLVLIFVLSLGEQKKGQGDQAAVAYSATDTDKPKVSVSSTSADLGKMKVNEERKADFTIENSGSRPLQLYKISSSCDCTSGQLIIEGNKSPEFGMHSQNPWTGTLDPGKKATLSVIYRPSVMPVKGDVSREVYMQTNDPEKGRLTFTVKAFVE